MTPAVGVLALQGDVEPHAEMLRGLGAEPLRVTTRDELERCTHLVLPGGESTTIQHLLALFGLWEPLRERARAGELLCLGTCAGAILLGRIAGARPPTLGVLDVDLERNAYGRQVDSFARLLDSEVFGRPLRGVFIRAPRITRVGADVRVLARDGADPVLVEGPAGIAATFHPELAGDPAVHERFLATHPAARARDSALAAQRST